MKGLKNKKAVSLMISYVILIAIVIGLSAGVYAWLRIISDVSPPTDCKEGTSLILEDSKCFPSSGTATFTLKNNGRFNVDGVIIAVGDIPQNTPTTYLIPHATGGVVEGNYIFLSPLKPGDSADAIFTDQGAPPGFNSIEIIQLQPFIISKNQKVVCLNTVIKQEIPSCSIA